MKIIRNFILIIIIFGGTSHHLSAQDWLNKKKAKLSFGFDLTNTYDDNILKYSEKYLERFMNYEDEGRFLIDTYDDLIINPSASLSFSLRLFGKKTSTFSFSGSTRQYLKNDVKNWDMFSISYQQNLRKGLRFNISYSYIPEFYIRNFRDDDLVDVYGYTRESFNSMSFSKDDFGIYIQNTFFKNTRLRLALDYYKYFYNSDYREYDSKDFHYYAKVWQPFLKKFEAELSYQLVKSYARGYDQEGESLETSDDSDATFVEDRFIFGLSWKPPKIAKKYHKIELETQFLNRYFTSDKPLELDQMHAGRVDENIRIFGTYYIKLNNSFSTTLFYKWYYRDSYTMGEGNSEFVSDEKDYVQNHMGIKFSYDLDYKFEKKKNKK